MTSENTIILTRQKLYDEVWNQSVTGVAKKYNLNYGRLIKSLKEADVPYPSSGYWTRVVCGKDVSGEVVQLSGAGEEAVKLLLANAVVSRSKKTKPVNVKATEPIQEQPKVEVVDVIPVVEPPADVELAIPDTILSFLPEEERAEVIRIISNLEIKQNAHLHKKLVEYKKSIKDWKDFQKNYSFPPRGRSSYNRSRNVEQPHFVNEVSDAGLERVILIMDVLFKAIEKLGGVVQQDLSVKIRQDMVRFKFAEGQDKVPHEITKQEAKELLEFKEAKRLGKYAYEPKIRKYDNVYNGKLRIVFDDSSYIRDSVDLKLEDRLEDILIQLYELSETHRIEREKREEQHRLYLEAQLREEEIKKRKQQEMEKTQALENIAKDYQIACEIRNYIAAVMNKGELTDADFEWIEWAKKKADWYDPVMAREDEYLGRREHSKFAEDKAIIKRRQNSIYGW